VLLEEDSGPTSAKTNLENILHKGESATHEMDAILKKQKNKTALEFIHVTELSTLSIKFTGSQMELFR